MDLDDILPHYAKLRRIQQGPQGLTLWFSWRDEHGPDKGQMYFRPVNGPPLPDIVRVERLWRDWHHVTAYNAAGDRQRYLGTGWHFAPKSFYRYARTLLSDPPRPYQFSSARARVATGPSSPTAAVTASDRPGPSAAR